MKGRFGRRGKWSVAIAAACLPWSCALEDRSFGEAGAGAPSTEVGAARPEREQDASSSAAPLGQPCDDTRACAAGVCIEGVCQADESAAPEGAAACVEDAGVCLSPSEPAPEVCVPRGPRDCTSELDNDCDGQPDDFVDDTCRCVPGTVEPCDEHPGLDGRGICRAGQRTCIAGENNATSDWGACEGAVGPEEADSCTIAGDDADCNGTPNGGCPCVDGQTVACGPSTDNGVCQFGVSTCVDGAFGPCEGAVFPASRNCASAQDNDCDGRPDDTVDNVCTCVIGDTQVCGEHPGQDGNGRCRAGTRRCEAGPNNLTSRFGACMGSVGPAAQDSCAAPGDDANCDGIRNGGCACIAGQGNAPCAGDPRASRCNAQGQCVPCQSNADCSLVSGGRTACNAGVCIAPVADGSACQQDAECQSGRCRDQFLNADGDAFPDLRAPSVRVCGNTPLPGRAFARADGQTDCCDSDARAFPGAVPPEVPIGFELQTIPEGAGFPEPNACGSFDYDCDGRQTSLGTQTRVYRDDGCFNLNVTGLSDMEAINRCAAASGWDGASPACGASGAFRLCGALGGSCSNLALLPPRPRLCF